MVRYDYVSDNPEKTQGCKTLIDNCRRELLQMWNRTVQTGREEIIYLYRKGGKWDTTKGSEGLWNEIPEPVDDKEAERVPLGVDMSYSVHTHPTITTGLSISDLLVHTVRTRKSYGDMKPPDFAGTGVITPVPTSGNLYLVMVETNEWVTQGWESEMEQMVNEAKSEFLTQINKGNIEEAEGIRRDLFTNVKKYVTYCARKIRRREMNEQDWGLMHSDFNYLLPPDERGGVIDLLDREDK